MSSNEIETHLKSMIVERLFLTVTPDEIKSDASLMDEYGVDSVCLLELVVGLEDEFGIVVEDGDFSVKNFDRVASIAKFVRERMVRSE